METLIIRVKDIFEAEKLIKYFRSSYRSTDSEGMIVVIPCSDPLAYGKEAAGLMGKTVQAYGIDKAGIKYSLLKLEAEKNSLTKA